MKSFSMTFDTVDGKEVTFTVEAVPPQKAAPKVVPNVQFSLKSAQGSAVTLAQGDMGAFYNALGAFLSTDSSQPEPKSNRPKKRK